MKNFQSAEVWEKATGRARYGMDLVFPGMLVGKILRSPHPHALIKKVDTSQAEQVSGVVKIITGKDLEQKPYGVAIDDELPLAVDKVRYKGDEVAAVAARDEETAKKALAAIQVEYVPLPLVGTPEEALETNAPPIHEGFPGNLAWERNLERGNLKQAFKEADLIIEENFSVPAVNQVYLEPVACVAVEDQYWGVTLYTPLQSPHMNSKVIAKALDLPPSKVRIVAPYMGGGFGGKVFGNQKVYILSALLAKDCGLPVKMQLTREEEFIAGRPMPYANFYIKMALKHDGTILGREADIVIDNGAYSAQMPFVAKTLSERNDSLYRIPNLYTRARLVYTNRVPTGQYRSYGNQLANFAFESMMDLAAKKLGIDPLTVRLKNATQKGEITVHGLNIKSCALTEALKTAAQEIGWKEKRPPNRGVGLACCIHLNGNTAGFKGFSGASAFIRLEEDGTITVITGEQDYGQGTHNSFTQIAARVLGVSPESIVVHSKDTATTPFSLGAFACRQLTIGGNAVKMAAENLKEKIISHAVDLKAQPSFEAAGEIEDGMIVFPEGDAVSLREVGQSVMYAQEGMPLMAEAYYQPPDTTDADASGYGNISPTYSFAAHAVEVEVDPETGEVTPLQLVAVHDSGKIMHQLVSKGQVFGGTAQGLGYAMMEGYIFQEGRALNPGLHVYQIPTSLDLPEVKPIFLEKEDPVGPFGAKGIGEIVQVPVLAAYTNAVADAAGVRIKDLPVTSEKVHFALKTTKGGGPR